MKATTSTDRAHFGYIDILRIISTLGVIAIHMPYFANIQCCEWRRDLPMAALNSIVRFAVPIFFMISGACNLNRSDFSFPKLFRKVGRLLLILFCWSTLYAAIAFFSEKETYGEFFYRILTGHYHLWFMYALILFYLFIPLLDWMMKEKNRFIYGTALIVLAMYLPMLTEISGSTALLRIGEAVDNMHIPQYSGYMFYFMAGYFLHKKSFPGVARKVIYCAGSIGCLLTIFLTICFSQGHKYNQEFFRYQNPAILLWASAIFLWVRYSTPTELSAKSCRCLALLGSATLGIYLAHPLILSMIYPLFKAPFARHPFLTSLVLIPTLFALALLLTAALKKIKFLRNIV